MFIDFQQVKRTDVSIQLNLWSHSLAYRSLQQYFCFCGVCTQSHSKMYFLNISHRKTVKGSTDWIKKRLKQSIMIRMQPMYSTGTPLLSTWECRCATFAAWMACTDTLSANILNDKLVNYDPSRSTRTISLISNLYHSAYNVSDCNPGKAFKLVHDELVVWQYDGIVHPLYRVITYCHQRGSVNIYANCIQLSYFRHVFSTTVLPYVE